MAFIKVENFLQKFFHLATREDLSIRVEACIKEKIPNANFKVRVKNKTIYLRGLSPAAKNEIFLMRQEILGELKNRLGAGAPQEINFRKS